MRASGDFRVVVGAGELVRLDCDAPVRVLCEQGALWITSSAAAEDICLSAGQQAQGCQGVVLLEGEGVLRVSLLDAPARQACSRPIGLVDCAT